MRRLRTKKQVSSFCVVAVGFALSSSATAEVLDLTNGEFSNTTRSQGAFVSGVLDLDRPAPEPTETVAPEPESEIPSTSPTVLVRGRAETEAAILRVALVYVDHPGIEAAELSVTEWAALFRANIAIESNFRQSARSPVGAIGLGQLMPATAAQLGVDPFDSEQNLHGSARYLLAQMLRFRSAELALAAYNAGPDAVVQYGGIPPYRETQNHVVKVFRIFRATTTQQENI